MPQLDSLRAFAVLAVLIHRFYPEIEPLNVNGGNYGVKLFFVLSGFLITGFFLTHEPYSNERGMDHL